MRFILLLLSPFACIILLFIFLPRPAIPSNNSGHIDNEEIAPVETVSTEMKTKISQYEKAQKILEKVDMDTQESKKRLAEFYARFNISPTPYEIAEVLGSSDSSESANNNLQLTTYNLQPTTIPRIGEIEENPIKTTYVIALLGDSMTDTLTPYLPTFKKLLTEKYPNYSIPIINFGQGSTDLESGLKRLMEGTIYNGKYYPSVLSYKPDILVVESFAYNSWSSLETDLNRQWITYAKIVDLVKSKSPDTKILFASAVAPNSAKFGDGKLNWNTRQKKEKTDTIKQYLVNLIRFTQSQNLPLADAYTQSIDANGNGKLELISTSDYIHPSQKGAELFWEKIIDQIQKNKLLP